MFQCDQCSFSSSKKYNLERHVKNIHGTLQTGYGAVLSEQSIPHHVPQEILNKNVVPIETYNHVSRQCQGWSSANKNISFNLSIQRLIYQIMHTNISFQWTKLKKISFFSRFMLYLGGQEVRKLMFLLK